MMRKSFLLLSIAAVAVGIWLIVRVHPLNGVCSSNSSPLTGAGISANCMNMVSFYFVGFALIVGGLIVMMLAMFSMAKHRRRRSDYHRDVRPAAPQQLHRENTQLNDAA